METLLRYLTGDDERLLLEKAERRSFAAGETIVREGGHEQALFLVRFGTVRVERAHHGKDVGFARMGPGSLFGEMSFLEREGASASVVAEEQSEIDVVPGPQVLALTQSVPGFGARFYESIAVMLSERLRETTALPGLLVEEVPQVNRFHARRASRAAVESVPPRLVENVEAFKSAIVLADRVILEGKVDADEAQRLVSDTCQLLNHALSDTVARHRERKEQIGAYVFRESFSVLMQSPFLDRSFSKPRGYAGDYETIEMIYRNEPDGPGRLGPLVDRWALDGASPKVVRARRGMTTELIRDVAARKEGETRVTCLASGPARELFDLYANGDAAPDVRALCLDVDPAALESAAAEAGGRGLAARFSFARENIIRLIRNRGSVDVEPQDVIYSLGLVDYFPDDLVVQLLDWVHDHLALGGVSAIGNYPPTSPDRAFLDHVLEWRLIYRPPEELEAVCRRSKFGDGPLEIRPEPSGVQLFAFATRAQ